MKPTEHELLQGELESFVNSAAFRIVKRDFEESFLQDTTDNVSLEDLGRRYLKESACMRVFRTFEALASATYAEAGDPDKSILLEDESLEDDGVLDELN